MDTPCFSHAGEMFTSVTRQPSHMDYRQAIAKRMVIILAMWLVFTSAKVNVSVVQGNKACSGQTMSFGTRRVHKKRCFSTLVDVNGQSHALPGKLYLDFFKPECVQLWFSCLPSDMMFAPTCSSRLLFASFLQQCCLNYLQLQYTPCYLSQPHLMAWM